MSVAADWAWYPFGQSKTIFLIRHAQGHHNVAGEKDIAAYKSWDWADASLTPLGFSQTRSLRRHLAQLSPAPRLDLVVVSPLTRTLQTACAVFGTPADEKPPSAGDQQAAPVLMLPSDEAPGFTSSGAPPFVATELCREHYGLHPCDARQSLSHYAKTFPAVDFSQVESEEDVLWKPDIRESDDDLLERSHHFVKWLLQRPEERIAVVTHSGFLHALLSHAGHDCPPPVQDYLRTGFRNCELRVLTLANKRNGSVAPTSIGLNFPGGHPSGPSAGSDLLDDVEGTVKEQEASDDANKS
ncbi:phosphoglycerate mutase [Klebsormidium nitens]|uniref:Phosphoglycerate mutase n=1 Tax=Klebsormidium nitens TaxID=105231 RepID=A0A1Y1IIX0_KLENI|nr:phosphoglycerate mutase [Klebsormidium nitens]|eukprot:GAQ90820.1 phosphoglycerate mutase [Klebsormidium nitens]